MSIAALPWYAHVGGVEVHEVPQHDDAEQCCCCVGADRC
jgi:hypothetical protein